MIASYISTFLIACTFSHLVNENNFFCANSLCQYGSPTPPPLLLSTAESTLISCQKICSVCPTTWSTVRTPGPPGGSCFGGYFPGHFLRPNALINLASDVTSRSDKISTTVRVA